MTYYATKNKYTWVPYVPSESQGLLFYLFILLVDPFSDMEHHLHPAEETLGS